VAYQRFLLDDTKENLESAFFAINDMKRQDPEDRVLNIALSELYYRVVINGCDIVPNPIQDGLLQVRSALRTNSACMRLHLLLAFMTFFSKDHQMAKIELDLCRESELSNYSFQFHSMVLLCLMSGLEEGLDQLKLLCNKVGAAPQLYVVMKYLDSMLMKKTDHAETCLRDLDKTVSLPVVLRCISHMVLPSSWSFKGGREQLKTNVMKHFTPAS